MRYTGEFNALRIKNVQRTSQPKAWSGQAIAELYIAGGSDGTKSSNGLVGPAQEVRENRPSEKVQKLKKSTI